MNNSHLSIALREIEKTRISNEKILSDRKIDLYQKISELDAIDNKIKNVARRIAITPFINPQEVDLAIQNLQISHKRLLLERKEILVKNGFAENYLSPIFKCNKCKDYGYIETDLCECVHKMCEQIAVSQSSYILNAKNQNFESFNMDLYSKIESPRYKLSPFENMQKHFNFCKNYAENFNSFSENVLMFGAPGLSKTFLSTSIASELSKKNVSVIHDNCIKIIDNFEKKKFGSNQSDLETEKYFKCDLLIIDDLGTEMSTSFTISAIYDLINTRIMENKPLIINTNFSFDEIGKKYSPAILSRIEGEFKHLFFFGDDVRKILKKL